MAQSIKKNFVYNVLLNTSSVIFPLITAPYVSRVLEPDGVGLNNFASTYAGYFAIVTMLGIPTYGVREVAKVKQDKVALTKLISQLISIALIMTFAVSAIYLLTLFVIGQLTENLIIFLLAGFVIYLSPFKINWYYQGLEEFSFITFRSLIIKTLSVVAMFVFVREKEDLIIYIILGVLGGVMADVWNFLRMWRSGIKPRFTIRGIKSHISPLLLLFASTVAISIYTLLDTLMLGFMKGYTEVGYYSNAMHISKLVLMLVTSLSVVAIPRVSFYTKDKDYGKINELMGKSFKIITFLAFPCAIGLSCVSPVFIPLFFGEYFVGSVIPLVILSMLIVAIGLNNLTGVQILVGMGYDKLFLYSVLVGTFINFLMNCILIPLWGAVGASIASVFDETLILFVTTVFVYKKTPIRISGWGDILKAFLGALSFIPIMLIMTNFIQGWAYVIIYVLTCGLVYLIIEALIRNSSIDFIKNIVLNKFRKS